MITATALPAHENHHCYWPPLYLLVPLLIMPLAYLKKELLTNVPATVLLKKRLPATDEKDFTTKEPTGRKQYPYVFVYSGRELWHYANEIEQGQLENYKEGEQVEVCRVEKEKSDGNRIYFLQWGSTGSVEMKAAPQLRSNTALVRQERDRDDMEIEQKRKSKSIGLRGLMQAHINCGKSNTEALKAAIEADEAVEMYVNSIQF